MGINTLHRIYNVVSKRQLSNQRKGEKNSPFLYCQELVRKYDYENFLASLLLPSGPREDVIAIRAFNVSVAQVQDQVSQGLIGQMRMKFWEDTLESMYHDAPPSQPVALQLHKAIKTNRLSKQWLQRLVSSREKNLNSKSFQSLSAVETYAENSVSPVLYLTLECLNVRNVHADHAASHIGRAQGLVTLLRAVPHNSQNNRVYVPIDLLVKHKVSQQALIRGTADKNVKDLVFDIASTANAHIEKARSLRGDVPASAKIALIPSVCTYSYLESLRRTDFNVFDGRLQQRNSLLPMQLWWKKFRNQF